MRRERKFIKRLYVNFLLPFLAGRESKLVLSILTSEGAPIGEGIVVGQSVVLLAFPPPLLPLEAGSVFVAPAARNEEGLARERMAGS